MFNGIGKRLSALENGGVTVTGRSDRVEWHRGWAVPALRSDGRAVYEGLSWQLSYNGAMRLAASVLVVLALAITAAVAQTPQPFPQPGAVRPSSPAVPPVPPPAGNSQAQQPAPSAATPSRSDHPSAPDAATVYFPIYPGAQFLASYDAGRGQRYYLYGTATPFLELVAYYRTQLKERGDQVFSQPPTHMFQVGRFRDETMAFPPGVTVKDWTWGGSQGYPNGKLGAQPARFPSVIMIVPPPPAPAPAR